MVDECVIHVQQAIAQKPRVSYLTYMFIGATSSFRPRVILLQKMEIIIQPLPRPHSIGIQPRRPIRQRSKEPESPSSNSQHRKSDKPNRNEGLTTHPFVRRDEVIRRRKFSRRGCFKSTRVLSQLFIGHVFGRRDRCCCSCRRYNRVLSEVDRVDVEDEFDQCTGYENRGQMRRQVVMEEPLATHHPKGEVMGCPTEQEEARTVVQSGSGPWSPNYKIRPQVSDVTG